jgi:tetratricopeptide (TPR) repeat protein
MPLLSALLKLAALLLAAALSACGTTPTAPPSPSALLHDGLFAAPLPEVSPEPIFAMSEAMRRYVDTQLVGAHNDNERRDRLLRALRDQGHLNLDYDDGFTRNAAEAFDKRAGNCLSLVVMTAAFAKHLGLPVRYQKVHVRESFSRAETLTFASGHVNVVLTTLPPASRHIYAEAEELTVDFVPPEDLRSARVQVLREATVVAMFMNNRAAEHLTAKQHDAAYAWARAAVLQDGSYLPAANTLAIVYLRSGHLAEAEAALRHVLAQAPDDEPALSNLVVTLARAGRTAEAAAMNERLASLQPHPPFHFLDLGVQALRAGDLAKARTLIARELRRQPYQHEAHYWAGVTDAMLGDAQAAEKHLRQAIEHSGSPAVGARYSAKLATLKGPRRQ